ncbi:MAG: hypothetical protein SGBAC_002957 [Bacillariaceae sp.]
MSTPQDINDFAEETNEKMNLRDQDENGDDPNDVSAGQSTMICTAESCSVPLNGSNDGTSSGDETTSDSKNKIEGESNPTDDTKERNKKNKRRNNKNMGGGTQQSVSPIQQIHTQNDLNKLLQQNNTVLLEFVTTWCGACHGIQPLYEELAQTEVENNANSDAMLRSTQVVCDKNKETKKLASMNGVGSYPVFVLYRQGREVSKWKGADVGKLEKTFENFGGGSGGKRGRDGKGKKGKGRR